MESALIRDAEHLRKSVWDMRTTDINDVVNVLAEACALVVTMARYIDRLEHLEENRHEHDSDA